MIELIVKAFRTFIEAIAEAIASIADDDYS